MILLPSHCTWWFVEIISTNGLVVWQPHLNQTAEHYCVVCQVSNSVRPIRLSLTQQIRMYTITDSCTHIPGYQFLLIWKQIMMFCPLSLSHSQTRSWGPTRTVVSAQGKATSSQRSLVCFCLDSSSWAQTPFLDVLLTVGLLLWAVIRLAVCWSGGPGCGPVRYSCMVFSTWGGK